jgi:hypothetical protein
MKRYEVTLEGLTPLLMHNDNLAFGEKVEAWQKDPANKEFQERGDDRSPAWRWLGYVYHDKKVFGLPSDNLMTMLREGGAKVINKGKETYKKQTQAGIMIDQQQWPILIGDKTVPVEPFFDLIGGNDFNAQLELAEKYGFELLVKRAKVGQAKHVRVRPMFRRWKAVGSLTVIDEELSGLVAPVLDTILAQAGALVGLGDWRPASPKSSGTFGKFAPKITPVK